MMKVLRKKRKGGFTLIELIVVIAILGILAAIAIPRLGGFTNTAKVKADLATYELVGKSVAIGVANGDLTTGTVVLTMTAGSGVFTGTAATDVAAEMATLMQTTPKFQVTGNAAKVATWTIAADGTITETGINATTGVIN